MFQLAAPSLMLALMVPSAAEPAVSLAGTVRDVSGAALPGAAVTLDCGTNPQTAAADSTGAFRFDPAPQTQCVLVAELPGCGNQVARAAHRRAAAREGAGRALVGEAVSENSPLCSVSTGYTSRC